MEIDTASQSTESMAKIMETGLFLRPVSPNASGNGLPYAPEDWPTIGDTWKWKVGGRINPKGYYVDRYLYLPSRLRALAPKKHTFASKLSVKQYIEKEFPEVAFDSFFASFSWKIPSKARGSMGRNNCLSISPTVLPEEVASDESGNVGCKARNRKCSSLVEDAGDLLLAAMDCIICCSEPGFCRDCCCILCCKTLDSAYRDYSFIKCEGRVSEDYICGHVAHIECGLRSYMAGTVGGGIGLDAEYYCRRCDTRTELVSHVTMLLQTCRSIESRDEIEKILNVGACILSGSEKQSAQRLLNHIELVMAKLRSGSCLEDVWKEEGNSLGSPPGVSSHENGAMEIIGPGDPQDIGTSTVLIPDIDKKCLELENEIDHVLRTLRTSQESEYEVVEESLNAQKEVLISLYQELLKKNAELSRCTSTSNPDALLNAFLDKQEQIKKETKIFRAMGEVANGLGKTAKSTMKKHFDLAI